MQSKTNYNLNVMKLNEITSDHIYIVENQINYLAPKNIVWRMNYLPVLEDAGYDALYYACEKYNPSRGASFKTFASLVIRQALVKEIERLNRRQFVELENSENELYIPNLNWDSEESDMMETLNEAINTLTAEEQHIIYQRFGFNGKELKLRELSTIMKVSNQAVNKRIKRILDKLRGYIESNYRSYRRCA